MCFPTQVCLASRHQEGEQLLAQLQERVAAVNSAHGEAGW